MSTIVDTLPQNIDPIVCVTLEEVIRSLPDQIPYKLDIWIADKIARFGRTDGNLIFLVKMDGEPTPELMTFFTNSVAKLGISATVSNKWKNNEYMALKLYNTDGNLLIDKKTMNYKDIPKDVFTAPVLTAEEVVKSLPDEVEWDFDIFLTGGIVRNGWSSNDLDILAPDAPDTATLLAIRKLVTMSVGWKTDVGTKVMPEREPVYLFKIYSNKKKCL